MRNKLYYFIKNEVDSASKDINKDRFNHKVNKNDQNYYFYNLEVAKNKSHILAENSNTHYQLTEHHVSFYDKQFDKDPCLSQYHYTGYFSDSKGKKYQLHVYFNQHDKLTSTPVFSICQEGKNLVKPIKTKEFLDYLIQLAIDNTFPLISKLRQSLNQKVNELEDHFNQLHTKLASLSHDLPNNNAVYDDCLKQTIPIADLLSVYLHSKQYKAIANFFIHHKKTFISNNASIAATVEPEKLLIEPFKQPTMTANEQKPLPQKQFVYLTANFIQKAIAARDDFIKSKDVDLTAQLESFLQFEKLACDALGLSYDKNYLTNAEDLRLIQDLIIDRKTYGTQLLETLLLNNKLLLANSLISFTNDLPPKVFTIALLTGNSKLLDFLLTYGEYAVNTHLVVGQLTPVLFCFKNHNAKYPKTDCLSVLIKHGASLMVKADNDLPVAYYIISIRQHPLRQALVNNMESIGNSRFHRSLIKHLEILLPTFTPGTPLAKKLLADIENIKISSANIKNHSSPIEVKTSKKAEELVDELSKKMSSSTLEELQKDENLQLQYAKYRAAHKAYNERLSKREQMQNNRQGINIIKNVNRLFTPGTIVDIQEVKKVVAQWTETFELKTELIDVVKELQLPNTNRKKIPALKQRCDDLVKRIKTLETEAPLFQNMDASETDFLQSVLNSSVPTFFVSKKTEIDQNNEKRYILDIKVVPNSGSTEVALPLSNSESASRPYQIKK